MDASRIDAAAIFQNRRVELSLLLDSGQMYTCLPEEVWQELGLEAKRTHSVHRSDGTTRTIGVSECVIQLDEGSATTPVLLGGPADLPILGTLTLAELGYLLDPLSREILPAVVRLRAAGPVGKGRIPSEAGLADPPPEFRRRSR